MIARLLRLSLLTTLALATLSLVASQAPLEAATPPYEVWAVDQAGDPGAISIYYGRSLERHGASAVPEVVDLGASVTPFCQALTGTAPVRGHMLMFNASHTHAILAYVASGHVVFIEAASRTPVGCIDAGVQAHAAFPTADERLVIVANQNGKLLQRIHTDYATNTFTLDEAATLNLASCTTPNGQPCQADGVRPDNAPICPVIESTGRRAFVTLRGGGLLVVDPSTTPMGIVAEYDLATVRPNGCGGVEKDGKLYLNAGGGTGGNPTEAAVYVFNLSAFGAANALNTPAPTLIFARDGNNDSHGMLLNSQKGGRYLWAADRFANTIEVIDTTTDTLVNTFSLVGRHSADPAPDLMAMAPNGKFAFVSLRGPCPLTANAPAVDNAVGATPGVGVLKVKAGGRAGDLVAVAPISRPSEPFACASVGGSPTLTERADIHGIAVRMRPEQR